ncbi:MULTISPECIES: hypothetical protein [unclassified Microbacterium]|uniref:hypothetical protein n=1 Tax=unclassified Microbacterium TaxID=2609290 RepID=UPI003449484D
MRQGSQELISTLSSTFERELKVNVYNGTERVLEGESFESWQLESDLGAKVCSSGSGVLVHESVHGESLSPVGTKGLLSPFRARVEPVLTIRDGDFEESVSLGMFRATGVPSTSDSTVEFRGKEVVSASRVAMRFESLDEDTRRWGFRAPEQSAAGASAFAEIRRLTGMPVEQNGVADVAIPALKTWEARRGSRLDAVLEIGRILGGSAVVNSRGAWVVIPDTVGEPVATLRLGELGTVLDVADEIDTDEVYNEVVGAFEDANGNPIRVVAEVKSGDLSVTGDYKPNTTYYSNDLVKTEDQARTAVQSILDLSTGSQVYDVQIQCHLNPLVEIGDVIKLEGWKRPLVGRLRRVSMSDSAYMNITLRVHRELT